MTAASGSNAGLAVPFGATLEITGASTGSLTAIGGSNGSAGIGSAGSGDSAGSGGTVTISGGSVNATGGENGAGVVGSGKAEASFTDVSPSDWYYSSVGTDVSADLVSGMGNGAFAPSAPITREQMAVMVAKALGNHAPAVAGSELNLFSDSSSVDSWAIKGMEQAIKSGIVNGMSGTLAPLDNATRVEAAAMTYKLLGVLDK